MNAPETSAQVGLEAETDVPPTCNCGDAPVAQTGSRNRSKAYVGILGPRSRADQLSSSLATIARQEQRARHASFLKESEYGEEESSSWSSDPTRQGPLSGTEPPLVTASATTSSGDDRNSSIGQKSVTASVEEEQSKETRHFHGHNHHTRRHAPAKMLPLADRHGRHELSNQPISKLDGGDDRKVPPQPLRSAAKKRRLHRSASAMSESSSDSSSSGSGSEDGYAGSESTQHSSSPSSSSSDEGVVTSLPRQVGGVFTMPYRYKNTGDGKRRIQRRHNSASSSSSFLADFSSSSVSGSEASSELKSLSRPVAPSKRHAENYADQHGEVERATGVARLSPNLKRRRVEFNPMPARNERLQRVPTPFAYRLDPSPLGRFSSKIEMATRRNFQGQNRPQFPFRHHATGKMPAKQSPTRLPILLNGRAPVFNLNSDLMACCMAYLQPQEVHFLLTVPITKEWSSSFGAARDLWRTLCVTPPFKARFDEDSGNESSSVASAPLHSGVALRHLFGKYRMLYTSFIRCMRYLDRIKDDAVNGRQPSVVDYGNADLTSLDMVASASLKKFLASANDVTRKNKQMPDVARKSSNGHPEEGAAGAAGTPYGVTDDASSVESLPMQPEQKKKKPTKSMVKFGHSKLTQRLLGPSKMGGAGNTNLPWSCAIYSIVNWMVAFSNVEGIQTMCLKVFPFVLEDESQRTTAQGAGLTDIVLRGMVRYPDSVELHTAAFHTLVLLARPLGGREGMLFHTSMVNSSGIFDDIGSRTGRNGIAVMLDSMRRFDSDPQLMAMSCWSLVNIALSPSQKSVLVKLGGIATIANAMVRHPYNAEVQFRALFALINLVIPSVVPQQDSPEAMALQEELGDINETTEKEMLDEHVVQISNLVVFAMKNFCSNESILNRACLVLHNLSLTLEYHETLLFTNDFYQMLEWCLANYLTDNVLQQSAAGTLHRVQATLSIDEDLRTRFRESLKSQQQSSLMEAHREALVLREQQERRLLPPEEAANEE